MTMLFSAARYVGSVCAKMVTVPECPPGPKACNVNAYMVFEARPSNTSAVAVVVLLRPLGVAVTS